MCGERINDMDFDSDSSLRRNVWARKAIRILDEELARSADTHLRKVVFEGLPNIDFSFKDESTQPTGSLKHRLARSLFFDAICSGFVGEDTIIVEASSGSTAISEAYFARLLGLKFVAVIPKGTSGAKVEAIEKFGGICHFVDNPQDVYATAEEIARRGGGYYFDQFANGARVTDWRRDNLAQSMFDQFGAAHGKTPDWVVVGVGTGCSASTIGRYIRYKGFLSRLCVVDVEYSAFYDAFVSGDNSIVVDTPSRIEGVGRQRVERSFLPGVVDRMIKVEDAASIAAMHVLSERIFFRVGASSGTNFFGACRIAACMREGGAAGSLLTLICDSGSRYSHSYYNETWLKDRGIDIRPWVIMLNRFLDTGVWQL